MTNNLLGDIKEMGFEHDKVIEILKEHQAKEKEIPAPEPEPPKEPEKKKVDEKEGSEGKPIEGLDLSEITKSITESVGKTVSEEIKKQLSILRKEAPSGNISDKPVADKPTITKNMFEVMV